MSAAQVRPDCHACGSRLAPLAPFCAVCGAVVRDADRVETQVGAAPDRVSTTGVGTGPLGVSPAPAGRRVAALVVDYGASVAVFFAALILLTMALSGAASAGAEGLFMAGLFGVYVIPNLAQVIFLIALLVWEGRTGKTLGNVAVGIRTVSVVAGGPPGFARAFGRRFLEALGNIVIVGSYVIAGSSAWDSSPRKQGWHDKAAGTTMVLAGPGPVAAQRDSRLASQQPLRGMTPSRPALLPPPAPPSPSPSRSPVATRAPALAVPAEGPPAEPTREEGPATVLAGVPRGAVISEVPGFSAVEDELVGESIAAAPPRHGVMAPAEEPAAIPTDGTGHLEDGMDHTRIAAPRPLTTPAVRLEFDTGEVHVITGTGLIGRNPAPAAGRTVEHLIAVNDPGRSVSKTHLEVGLGPEGFWILDRGSTNGTCTVSPDGVRAEVAPGAPVAVPVASTVEFGDRRFRVSVP